jgi:anti-sigma-K factor RskA
MTVHDDAFLDQLAVLALGALPEAEARALAEHVASCPQCRAEYASLRATADLVAFAAEPAPGEPSSGEDAARLKERVMRAVRAATPAKPAALRPVRPAFANWPAVVALAACIALVVTLAAFGLREQSDGRRIAALERNLRAERRNAAAADARTGELESRLAALLAPGSRHYAIANGEVVTSGGRILMVLRIPPAPAGKVYQAWTLRTGATTVSPSITFRPVQSGVAVIELPEAAAGLAAVAVSIEPEGGSQAPTSAPIVVRKL